MKNWSWCIFLNKHFLWNFCLWKLGDAMFYHLWAEPQESWWCNSDLSTYIWHAVVLMAFQKVRDHGALMLQGKRRDAEQLQKTANLSHFPFCSLNPLTYWIMLSCTVIILEWWFLLKSSQKTYRNNAFQAFCIFLSPVKFILWLHKNLIIVMN